MWLHYQFEILVLRVLDQRLVRASVEGDYAVALADSHDVPRDVDAVHLGAHRQVDVMSRLEVCYLLVVHHYDLLIELLLGWDLGSIGHVPPLDNSIIAATDKSVLTLSWQYLVLFQ